MSYKLGKLHEAGSSDEQEFWTQEIDYLLPSTVNGMPMRQHSACIEVHAPTKELLDERVRAIMFAVELMT